MEETNTHLTVTCQRHCPYCHEFISNQACKCKHCGEFFKNISWWEKALTKTGAYIGVFTALLSVFYACREGYFYVQQQQQARTEKATYLQTADVFITQAKRSYLLKTLYLLQSTSNIDQKRTLFQLYSPFQLQASRTTFHRGFGKLLRLSHRFQLGTHLLEEAHLNPLVEALSLYTRFQNLK